MNHGDKNRASLVSVITTPLGFFALSLLIVEGFLGIILIGSNLDPSQKFWGLLIGSGLFLLVVILVTLLVWRKPQNLTFSESSHLEHDRTFGTPGISLTEKQLDDSVKVSGGQDNVQEAGTQ